jgi:hypothetical protein
MGIVPLLLLAFLFVTVGFIGGVLMTLWWVERVKPHQVSKENEAQTDEKQDSQETGSKEPVPFIESTDHTLQPAFEDLLDTKSAVIEKRSFLSRKRVPKTNASEEIKVETAKPVNLVAQIDAILQDLILQSSMPKRSIRLVEDPLQGVVVWVGLEKYLGIEAVPDDEIRAVIQKAVREWEQRMSSK